MNKKLSNAGKEILKNLLSKCTEKEQLLFKRMYSHENLELPINDVVDKMGDDKIDWAITQCEKTIEKKKGNKIETAEEFCERIDNEEGETWSNDYVKLPEKIREYAEYYHKSMLKIKKEN